MISTCETFLDCLIALGLCQFLVVSRYLRIKGSFVLSLYVKLHCAEYSVLWRPREASPVSQYYSSFPSDVPAGEFTAFMNELTSET